MKEILMTLFKAWLFYKPEKYIFHQEKINFLKYVIIPGGLSIDLSKINIILE
jgi:hypothetical protein